MVTTTPANGAYPHVLASGGQYFGPGVSVSTGAPVQDRLHLVPFVTAGTDIDRIGVEVTATAAGSTVRLGVYADGGDGVPGALLFDAGTVDSASATGFVEITVTETLPSGLVWLAAVAQGGNPTLRSVAAHSLSYMVGRSGVSFGVQQTLVGYWQGSVSGALPDPAVVSVSNAVASSPRVMIRPV